MATPTKMNKTMPTIEWDSVQAAVKSLGLDVTRISGIDISVRSISVTHVVEPGVTTTTTYMINRTKPMTKPAPPAAPCGEPVPTCVDAGSHEPVCRCSRTSGHTGLHSSSMKD